MEGDMMESIDKFSKGQKMLKGNLAEFRQALEDEIDKIRKSGQSSTLLYSGRQIESKGASFWYLFNVEYLPSLPADTPCKLIIGNDQYDVTVISFEETTIVVSSKISLPDTLGKARLENGAVILMERLIKCIEDNSEKPNAIGDRVIHMNDVDYLSQTLYAYDDLSFSKENTEKQNQAIQKALTEDITYIWGPPGTGKTSVIGQIVENLSKQDRSVLLLSHTNTAVDGAIEKAVKQHPLTDYVDQEYPILRLGTPVKSITDEVLLEKHIEKLGKELHEEKISFEKKQSEIQSQISLIKPILAKAEWLKEARLDRIQDSIQITSDLKGFVRSIENEVLELSIIIEREKIANPDYGYYLSLAKTYKKNQIVYESVCNHLLSCKKKIIELSDKIQVAMDESKKHDIYSSIKVVESGYLSIQFYKTELNKIDTKKTSIENEIKRVNEERQSLITMISDYDKMSSLAKFFVSKTSIAETHSKLQKIEAHLPHLKEEIERLNTLESDYKKKSDELLLVQMQIKAVIPSNTKEYWLDMELKLSTELDTFKNTLKEVQIEHDKLSVLVEELEEKVTKVKSPFDIISEISRKQSNLKGKMEKLLDEIEEEENKCSEFIERERLLCSSFFEFPNNLSNSEALMRLKAQYNSISNELSAFSISELNAKKELYESDLIDVFRKLDSLKLKIQELEKQVVKNAKIVGTTLAKSYLSEILRERTFDTVIIDEASMAPIPAIWCATYLATSSIIIVGDFLQLPPIVLADTAIAKKWLGKDIFAHNELDEKAKNKEKCPENFVMLNDQFRMESDIADIANIYYGSYDGLKSYDMMANRIKQRDEFYKWFNGKKTKENVHLIDTENLHAWVTGVPQGKGHSRLNCFSAAVDVDLAFSFIENKISENNVEDGSSRDNPSVLIVAPYKPHVMLINQLIELEAKNRGYDDTFGYIKAGTVHSFQGNEADIVIFDLVIDEPHWRANLFMSEKEINDSLRKMFNVAVTRARFKLYIVGNFSYCQKRAKNNALSELLDKLIKKDKLKILDAKKLLPNIIFDRKKNVIEGNEFSGKHIVCREEDFYDLFLRDIRSFEERIVIYSPFMTENRISILLPSFVDAISLGKSIIVVTKPPSDRGKAESEHYKKCEKILKEVGVSIIHKKGMHEKLILIDSNVVWIGSLNVLSFTGSTGEIMQRHDDKSLTVEYEKLLTIEHLFQVVENVHEQKCPICGDEMIAREGENGGIYWECNSKDYTRNSLQQYPVDGILRCECGAPYVFSMKSEPRWICTMNSKHFQKMRENDLKLSKMAALIPTKKACKEVEKYFSAKRKERDLNKEKLSDGKKNVQNDETTTGEYEQLKLF